jgi:hypothetical protein
MRRCFHCGTKTDVDRLTTVGDGEFCESCFQDLLRQAPTRATLATPPANVPNAGPAEPEQARCLVCERVIVDEPAVSFLGGEICSVCSGEIAEELRLAKPTEDTHQSVQRVAGSLPAEVPSAASSTGERLFTPGSGTRWCAGCERPMPGAGSYRIIDGNPYCPACVPFYAAQKLERRSASATSQKRAPTFGQAACDCCGRPAGAETSACEGFLLCEACLGSDIDLALRVARVRHRRRLENLSGALDTKGRS